MSDSYTLDGMVYGKTNEPNPPNLTEHIELPELGDTNPDKGVSTFYSIDHRSIADPAVFPEAVPDHLVDVGREVAQSGRPTSVIVPPVRVLGSQQHIFTSYHFNPTDPVARILASDGMRRSATISIIPDDFSATGAIVYLGSSGSLPSSAGPGSVICASAVPGSLVRVITSQDELYAVIDSTSKAVWISVYAERYT